MRCRGGKTAKTTAVSLRRTIRKQDIEMEDKRNTCTYQIPHLVSLDPIFSNGSEAAIRRTYAAS